MDQIEGKTLKTLTLPGSMGSSKENSLFNNVFRTELSTSEAFFRTGARNIAYGGIAGGLTGSIEIGLGLVGLVTFIGVLPWGLLLGTARRGDRETSGYHHGPGEGKRVRYRGKGAVS